MAQTQSVSVRGTIEEIAEHFRTNVPSIPRHRRYPEDFDDVLPMLRPRGQQRSRPLASLALLSEKIRQERCCSKRAAIEEACKLLKDKYGQPLFATLHYNDVQKQLNDADRAVHSDMPRITTDHIVVAMFYGEFVLAASMYKAALPPVRSKIRGFLEQLSIASADQNTG